MHLWPLPYICMDNASVHTKCFRLGVSGVAGESVCYLCICLPPLTTSARILLTQHVMSQSGDAHEFAVAGDLMKSMALLLYKAEESQLELRAKDYASNWMTAVEMLDDDVYLGAENSYNILTVRKNNDDALDDQRTRLEVRLVPTCMHHYVLMT